MILEIEVFEVESVFSSLLNETAFRDDKEALDQLCSEFRSRFSLELGKYKVEEDKLASFFKEVTFDIIDQTLLGLVDKNLVNMSVDEEGEFLYSLKKDQPWIQM